MRNKKIRAAVSLVLGLLLLFALVPAAWAEEEAVSAGPSYADPSVIPSNGTEGWPLLEDTYSDYFCVMDADTGTILAEKGMDTETPPASLTKILTCLVALKYGDLDQQVTMSETGVEYAISGSSNLYTQVGEVFTLRDMLYGMMLKSANDIATEIGVAVGGTLEHFLEMMNEEAEALGCTHSYFANACGMPNEAHHSSAHDLALISKAALENDLFREIVHTKVYTIPATNMNEERTFQNHHKFLVTEEYAYDGIIGGKTGYTDLAGSCLATYVERDGRTVIVIALHCMGMDNCLNDTRRLCNYGLGEFRSVTIPNVTDEIVSGGTLTLPNDASFEQCEVSSSSAAQEDGSELVTGTYYWHGREVGTMVTKKLPTVSSAAEAAQESAAEGGETEEGAAASPDKDAASAGAKGSANGENPGSGAVRSSQDGSLVRTIFIIGGILLAIILILLIVSIHLRRERNRRRRRNQRAEDERRRKQD